MVASRTRTARSTWIAILVVFLAAGAWLAAPPARAQSALAQGPGGPILVVVDPGDPFGDYVSEILRAEGLNEFATTSTPSLSPAALAGHDVVVLARAALSASQVSVLAGWVQSGGKLIAIRPDKQLAPLLGLADTGATLDNGYLQVNTATPPGAGITADTMQFHGTADRYALAGASAVATLFSTASTATSNPAVTVRSVGPAGGQVAAFTYDLPRSVVLTRQGNPDNEGQKLDGAIAPIRSDDLFFPSWVDFSKIAIPQADEQQRLLANIVTQMSLDRRPLPRFWYLPRGEEAAVVMTGDDHDVGGTEGQFQWFADHSPQGCSVGDWQCVRSTSYVYPGTPIPDAAGFQAAGFEIALHLSTGCDNYTTASLAADWDTQLADFATAYPSLAKPRTNRTHCIAWSDWAGEPKAEAAHGVRFDTNYYYWPGTWVQNRPGVFTGSGFPMRFADKDGSLIDVYQATTQLTDESDIDIPTHIRALLDGALGPNGYYGVFTANMHTDNADHPGAQAIVNEAQSRGVPVVSAVQMLDWLDGRNGSSFGGLVFEGGRLHFSVQRAAGSNGLMALLPAAASTGAFAGLTRDGAPVSTTTRTVKGIAYELFGATTGNYVAQYGPVTGSAAAVAPVAVRRSATRPRITLKLLTTRASKRGTITLRVGCPKSAKRCRISLLLKAGHTTVARKTVRVRGGRSVKVTLKLTKAARRLLAKRGRLKVSCRISATDAAGHRSTRTVKFTVRAPRHAKA